ncbi:MAG: leucine--tRNA ligase [Elusimicrobia bacterium]|nr:leucine--tRNA ligase [Elusimicrobiota bacterium]
MADYTFREIEHKWQGIWDTNKSFAADASSAKKKYYCLVMFPYPSGNLHMGHVRNYSIGDVFARFHRMRGYEVIHPIGWDSFGLPAENAAIKNNIHPEVWTKENIHHMGLQLRALGISYDWDRELATCDPQYYRWNQWFFLKMWEKGLVFRKKAKVNWCPSCQTVLANEQVNQGLCWRCDSAVLDRELVQWFIKITAYAEELLSGHEKLQGQWPEQVLLMQKNWIGKSVGAEVDFSMVSADGVVLSTVRVFTTRPDTLFGATFMVVAPEHDIIAAVNDTITNSSAVATYAEQSKRKTTIERTANKEKTGLQLRGVFAINPVNGNRIPVFTADYVLTGYGTGAIMAVPAHDQRDWEFAKKYSLPIVEVIHSSGNDISRQAYEGEGVMVNSGQFDGTPSENGVSVVTAWLESKQLGKKAVNYRLKEWLVSRQRYWGTPIPMIHCPVCGVVPVTEKDLPIILPKDVQFTGAGQSPLATSEAFNAVNCPQCGISARRETDTMDTFVDSSWYYARYCDAKNASRPFDSAAANHWLAVDQYVGGIEHACMHLIYARFWHKCMRDLGLVTTDEPFSRLLTQGMVTLGGSAMSKSKGNVVAPDAIIEQYGADTARLFILFAAPPQKQLDWSDDGVEGAWRFLNRVWRLRELVQGPFAPAKEPLVAHDAPILSLRKRMNRTIAVVTSDIMREQQLNTAISRIMELVNELYAYPCHGHDNGVSREAYETVLKLLSPFVPHVTEEIWSALGHREHLGMSAWPVADEKYLHDDTIELPVQVNGKLRGKVSISADASADAVRDIAVNDEKLKIYFSGKKIVKFIYVPGKIVTIVVQ